MSAFLCLACLGLGACLGACLGCVVTALVVAGKREDHERQSYGGTDE